MTEETGKFLISVLVIVLLIMLVVKLVSLFTVSAEYQQANSTLTSLDKIILSLDKGESQVYLLESPKDWVIFVPFATSLVESRTVKGSTYQLCVAKTKDMETYSDYRTLPEKKKICKDYLDVNLELEIPEGCKFAEEVTQANCISLYNVPRAIKLEKVSENKVRIWSTYVTDMPSNQQTYTTQYLISGLEGGKLSPNPEYSASYLFLGISPEVEKQKQFFSPKSKKLGGISYTYIEQGFVGGVNLIYIPRTGKIHLAKGELFFEQVGAILENGEIWLSEEIMNDFFDTSKLAFDKNKEVTFYPNLGGLRLYFKLDKSVAYKTNLKIEENTIGKLNIEKGFFMRWRNYFE